MYFEHAALNVPDPRAMAAWYIKNCGLNIVKSIDVPPYMHFLADATGRVILEIYANPKAPIPDYASQEPLMLHIAYAVEDAGTAKDALLAAGATLCSDSGASEDGTRLVMLRDPWGIPLQLCQRGTPLIMR
ncbi:MAG: VOC family protein [Anaerolineales bacterium]|nr:MAG: VOC family protein [Anaerolineales bacterium]